MNDAELCQELMTRAKEYQKKKEKEFAIVELEKLKTEFEEKEGVFTSYNFVKAIDERISELK